MTNNKRAIILTIVFSTLLMATLVSATFAFFNYTRTGGSNTLSTGLIDFSFTDDTLMDLSNEFPQDVDMTNQEEVAMKSTHTGSLNISGHNTLTDGVRYSIYVVHGDDISGKQRLADSSIKFQLEPDFNSGTNGFTVLTNDYVTPTNLSFTNGKALISTGLVKDTTELTTVSYNFYMWIDAGTTHISSTTKRATLAEGNPSLADTTTGNTTADRYMKNDGVLTTVTLYPARSSEAGKIIYTTNEFSNGYYNIKFMVVADENETAAQQISKLPNLEEVADAKRFVGSSVNNYVQFNGNELWRIVGVYGDQLKIIKAEPLLNQSYNDLATTDPWEGSRLELYLNQQTSGGYYYSLTSTAKDMIETGTWNVGACDKDIAAAEAYTCAKTTTLQRNVGILASYEYLYGVENDGTCWTTIGSSYGTSCAAKDWLYDTLVRVSSGSRFNAVLINPFTDSTYILRVGYNTGAIERNGKTIGYNASPVVYLKSTVLIMSGTGTAADPYILK